MQGVRQDTWRRTGPEARRIFAEADSRERGPPASSVVVYIDYAAAWTHDCECASDLSLLFTPIQQEEPMKIRNITAVLICALGASVASAQAPAAPAAPEPPASPAAPPAPTAPPTAPKTAIVEGTLFKTQRTNNDKGKFEWICTYNVAGSRRSVQLDESCPSSMVFELKRQIP